MPIFCQFWGGLKYSSLLASWRFECLKYTSTHLYLDAQVQVTPISWQHLLVKWKPSTVLHSPLASYFSQAMLWALMSAKYAHQAHPARLFCGHQWVLNMPTELTFTLSLLSSSKYQSSIATKYVLNIQFTLQHKNNIIMYNSVLLLRYLLTSPSKIHDRDVQWMKYCHLP